MNKLNFPLDLKFKIGTLSNDFIATDARGETVAYVRQKMLKLIEEVQVFSDDSRSQLNYSIRANQWLDFSASYTFVNSEGKYLGRIARKGWASLWKARYNIFNEDEIKYLFIHETNPWIKVLDAFLEQVPVLGLLSGYFFHPCYAVANEHNETLVTLAKQSSFWGRRFKIDKYKELEPADEERILLGLMMMILLE